jgi:hypothetical protein
MDALEERIEGVALDDVADIIRAGFPNELNRAERVAQAKAEFRAEIGDWPGDAVSTSQSVGVQAFTLIAPRRM